jgi:ribosomal protein S18 acetylase RimI-like enzyme
MRLTRSMRRGEDEPYILQVDTAFTTDRIYKVTQNGLSLGLEMCEINPVLQKDYGPIANLDEYPYVFVVEADSTICGVAALRIEAWNNRMRLEHLYVSKRFRGSGIGKLLVQSSIDCAKRSNMRCLWLETQNINYPVIQFYQTMGFKWCGLDTELYDGSKDVDFEIALFFAQPIA